MRQAMPKLTEISRALLKFLAMFKIEDGEAQAIFGRRCIATIQIALSSDGGTLQKVGEDSWKALIQS
jgi:hypothetical protein